MSKKQARKAVQAQAAALAPAPSVTSLDKASACTDDEAPMLPGSLLPSTASVAAPISARVDTAALQPSTLPGAPGVTSPHAAEPDIPEPALSKTEGISDRTSNQTYQHGSARDHAHHVPGRKALLHSDFQDDLDWFMHAQRQQEDKNPYQALEEFDEAAAMVADDGQAGRETMPASNLTPPDHHSRSLPTDQPRPGLTDASMSALLSEAAQQRQPGKVLTLPRPHSSPRQPERGLPVGPVLPSQAAAQPIVLHNKV